MWYTANLLFKRIRISGHADDAFWEESIRLIEANSEREAAEKAEILGQQGYASFETASGEVAWKFDRVERVYEIESPSLAHGTELFSRFLRDSEVVSLLKPFPDE